MSTDIVIIGLSELFQFEDRTKAGIGEFMSSFWPFKLVAMIASHIDDSSHMMAQMI